MWTIDADMSESEREAIMADLNRAMSTEPATMPTPKPAVTVPVPPKPLTDDQNLERLVLCLEIADETLRGIADVGRMDIVRKYESARAVLIDEIRRIGDRIKHGSKG